MKSRGGKTRASHQYLPAKPVLAEMPNGRFRVIYADPDVEVLLKSKAISHFNAYVVKVKSEAELESCRLYRPALAEAVGES